MGRPRQVDSTTALRAHRPPLPPLILHEPADGPSSPRPGARCQGRRRAPSCSRGWKAS
jgi:hypothetical protein